jgi:hypothetical protein
VRHAGCVPAAPKPPPEDVYAATVSFPLRACAGTPAGTSTSTSPRPWRSGSTGRPSTSTGRCSGLRRGRRLRPVVDRDPVKEFLGLPRRIYLDTSVLRTVVDFGGVIWEGEALIPTRRTLNYKGFEQQLDALRMILLINERAGFEFVVTDVALAEVRGKRGNRYTQWVYDARDVWLDQSAGREMPPWGRKFEHRSLSGRISSRT